MKNIRKSKLGAFALGILAEIAGITEGIVDVFIDQKHFYTKFNNDDYELKKYLKKVAELKRTGYLEIVEKDGSKSISLTKKGLITTIENDLDSSLDGYWRMLSFDIPEELRNKRDQFRRSIKRIGYKQVQKSLWTCPFVRSNKVQLIINELELNDYVAYLVVAKSDIEEHLKDLFKDELADK